MMEEVHAVATTL